MRGQSPRTPTGPQPTSTCPHPNPHLTQTPPLHSRFGEKYRQWNAAFEAGYASARGKPIITIHPPSLSHMLKEVNAASKCVCEEPEQVVDILDYTITGKLPEPKDGEDWTTSEAIWGKGNKNP